MKRTVIAILGIAGVVLLLALAPLPWPAAIVGGHIRNETDIAAPPARVFAYVATPANWPRWHPESRAVRGIVDRTPGIGETVTESFEIAGRKGEATWTTLELDAPRRWRFIADSGGGGEAEIAYTLVPTTAGTRFERELFYRGPNLLFGVLNLLRVRSVVEHDSATALANVKRDLEGSPGAQ